MTVQEALRNAIVQLRGASIDDPARDARRLAAHALGWDMHRLTLDAANEMPAEANAAFNKLIAARLDHIPLSHLVGGRLFYGRWFTVTKAVLDPRPETETLVAAALEHRFDTVLDLGTGSGAIILTLLAERPNATGVGTDLSEDALEIALANAADCAERVQFIRSDWYATLTGRFDLIVSNPPYIAADEMDGLQPEVRLYEPRMALTDEGDGLGAYRIIAGGASDHLTPGGRLLVEIGPTQGQAVSHMMQEAGLTDIRVLPDLDGRDRVVAGVQPL